MKRWLNYPVAFTDPHFGLHAGTTYNQIEIWLEIGMGGVC
jgi:hypothetical protein